MPRILIVDDDENLRKVLEKLLTIKGHEVRTAENGIDAIKLMEHESFDLVITDILMPDMDGYELIRALRKGEAPPRIIAISGGSGRLDSEYLLEVAKRMKADKLLQKPISIAAIDAAVNEVMGAGGPGTSP